MNQILQNFIPLGDTGSICYLQDTLKDFDSNNSSLIQNRLKELKEKKVQKLLLLRSLTKQVNYDSITPILSKNGFQVSIYTPNSDFKSQVELFESILDSNKTGNICILFYGSSPALIELTVKLVLYIDTNASIDDIYSYLTNEEPDIITKNEFKNYLEFLTNDPYLITKPDRSEFKKDPTLASLSAQVNGNKLELPAEDDKNNTVITLNLNSLKSNIPDDAPLLTETEAIQFNLNSLVESDFEKEESPEEHYQKIKNSARREIDDSLSLDVNLSEEIEYISSLENLSAPTMDKISIINIDTIPLDTDSFSKIPNPTIDYKNKEYLDFDAIIEDEIEQEMLTQDITGSLPSKGKIPFPSALELDDIIGDDKEDVFSFDDDTEVVNDSTINLDAMDTKANIDLSFPAPLQDLEDLLDDDMELDHEKQQIEDDPVDPSQTFMVKRINDVIKNEVLNEDSKSKIPVSDLTKVDTKNIEPIPLNTNPTTPKVSNPKISSPKFNPITLDD